VTQGAGLSLRWFRDQFAAAPGGRKENYDELTKEAEKASPGSDGLLWAPYLMGERTPHLDPNARGALVGITAQHTRAHVIRAILEGVAFSLKDTFALFSVLGVPVKSVRLGGGGARSPLWRQIQADVYGMPVDLVAADEGGAYGAGLLAGVGVGVWPSADEGCKIAVRVAKRIEAIPQNVDLMERQYQEFRKIYPALRSVARASGAAR
jgi:xylulokinase